MDVPSSSTIAVLAEKPSVARDIARVLGAGKRGEGYFQGNGYVVTWAIGHLVALAQPHEINSEWRRWRPETLPMLPQRWPLVVSDKTRDQFEIVKRILTSPRVSRIICATDAGREGELIFRYIYQAADCEKPFDRLWISSLTAEAIRAGFAALRPGTEFDRLADAASGRSRADWLVGMNLSRAYSLAYNEELSVGRVQTPTLAMLVERELALQNFVPEDYIEVVGEFHPSAQPSKNTYEGTWFVSLPDGKPAGGTVQNSTRLPPDGAEAKQIVARVKKGVARIESITAETQRILPPLLYDLTELQRHANRLFGFTAQKTLDIAQALYERHKLISYPRSDSRHLSSDVAKTLPAVTKAVGSAYRELLAPGTGERPLGRRFVDDTKVSDHHAIIPTVSAAARNALSADESKLYDLICRRLLSSWHDDHLVAVTTLITAITSTDTVDRFHTSGSAVQQVGWKVLDLPPETKKGTREKDTDGQALPPGLKPEEALDIPGIKAVPKKTRPPKRFTEATLLTAMETAGKTLEERELSQAMKESGLGTPATRAAIIEVLLKRGYIVRSGKTLEATDKGIHLIEVVHPEVKSPAMTGQWEAYLQRIHQGSAHLQPFMEGIENYVREVVAKVEAAPSAAPVRNGTSHRAENPPAPSPAVQSLSGNLENKSLEELLHEAFGFSEFRPNQETVCRAAIAGKDVLLVMPTGAGKSLCYQLPGLARGGTTLVISPLIALMEDQAAKLRERGFRVDRIHSGRDRATSRQVCIEYLEGKLQFLFIAPERLRVTGFPQMLARRKPGLIAIDEAHCISQWGHDFRPDYRMLGQHLPLLRPAPVIALTATATPAVQRDIVDQLSLTQPARFIHGFRRDNLAVEIVEAPPSRRPSLAREILSDESRRPAIVYVPTRKQAESLCAELTADFKVKAYHAGLDNEHRNRVQQDFLSGKIDIMIATIAFGMGIDKPDVRTVVHTALPGSLEGYYQEIGRAGRDGDPSRAILMHSYADRHTHDFFIERDYPNVEILDRIYKGLTDEAIPKDVLKKRLQVDSDLFDKALEKLWTHLGASVDFEENVKRGEPGWRQSYVEVGQHKAAQLDAMLRFAAGHHCRMASLVRHFGDFADSKTHCGICDFCAPEDCIAQQFRSASAPEIAAASRIADALRGGGSKSTGRLHAELYPHSEVTRDNFEEVLGAMARSGYITLKEETFEKDNKQIPYRTVQLTAAGYEEDRGESNGNVFASLAMKQLEVSTAPRPRKPRQKLTQPKPSRGRSHRPATESEDEKLTAALRAWRLSEARRLGIPAFRIFADRVLIQIVEQRPSSDSELLSISGIGSASARKYGPDIFRIVAQN
jgi:DNA topoisomerase III